MKVMIARLNHETNTFSPVPTPLSAFGNDGPAYGAQAYAENKGKRTAMSAFIDIAEANGRADRGHEEAEVAAPSAAFGFDFRIHEIPPDFSHFSQNTVPKGADMPSLYQTNGQLQAAVTHLTNICAKTRPPRVGRPRDRVSAHRSRMPLLYMKRLLL